MAEAPPSSVAAMDSRQHKISASAVAAIVIATKASPGVAATLAEEPWHGRPLLAGVIERLGNLDVVAAVVRDEVAAELIEEFDDVVVIVDPEWLEGDASPLRAGLDYLTHSSNVAAAFVVTLDSPEIEPGALDDLVAAFTSAETPVVVPKYRYLRGGPVLLGREIWPRLLGAEGALDLEHFLLAHPQWVTEVRIDLAPPRRVSTIDDLAELAG